MYWLSNKQTPKCKLALKPAHVKTKIHVPYLPAVLQVVILGPGLLLSYSVFSPRFESFHSDLHQAERWKRENGQLLLGGFHGPGLEVAAIISSKIP